MKKGEVKKNLQSHCQILFHPILSYFHTTFGLCQEDYKNTSQLTLSSLPDFHCPSCQTKLHRHGQRYRIVMQVWIQMFICPGCRQFVSLLPTFCIPFKHHSAQTVNEIIDLLLIDYVSHAFLYHQNYSFAVHTAKRWAHEFMTFLPKLSVILSRLGVMNATESYHSFQSSLKVFFEGNDSFINEHQYFSAVQKILSGRSPPCGLFRFLS